MLVRSYQPSDYEQLKVLYLDSSTFGGQFDEARDAADRLQRKIEAYDNSQFISNIFKKGDDLNAPEFKDII